MSHAKRLDNASSLFFLLGFMVSKLQFVPNIIFASLANLISLLFYMTGYLLWLIGSYLHPDYSKSDNKWYGFAQFREQHQIASILGLTACLVSMAAFLAPIALIPAAWIFLASNLIWSISEYHKLKNPPQDEPNFSAGQQNSYMYYASILTTETFIVALTTTLAFMFPVIALPIFIVSTILAIGLGALSLEYWLDFNFGEHTQTPIPSSYQHLNHNFPSQHIATEHVQPYQSQALFSREDTPINNLPGMEHEYSCTSVQ